jgi:3,4-dihydroxy 2-butanone 4-phosphate synthase
MSEMFTGRVGEIGEVIGVSDTQIVVRAPKSAGRLRPGGSLTVAGVCLTIEDIKDGQIVANLSEETRRRTTFDRCTGGERVNVETALAVGDPLDGHMVQGHVDAVGKVAGIDAAGTGRRIWIRPPDRFLRRVVAKGSIAVDGASLTVAEVVQDRFSVVLIPATLQQTTLHTLARGDRVNLESDLVSLLVSAGSPAPAAGIARAVGSLGWAGHLSGRTGVEKTVTQLAAGGGVMVWDPDREGEGDVIFAGATMSPRAFVFLRTRCCGHSPVPCAPEVLERLEIAPIPGEGDRHGTRQHVPVDLASGTGTGVSNAERAATSDAVTAPWRACSPTGVLGTSWASIHPAGC